MKQLFHTYNLFSPKEVNMMLRTWLLGKEVFEYGGFGEVLYDVRFELARSRLMDTN